MGMWKKILSILVVGLILTGAAACSLPTKASDNNTNVAEDTATFVTGTGSLATQMETRLSFGSSGKIAEVFFKEGDNVTQGTALARLETDALEVAEIQAEIDLTAAQNNLTKSNLSLIAAERDMDNLESEEEALKFAVINAQIKLDQAKFYLEQTHDNFAATDIIAAKAEVDAAEKYMNDLLDTVGKFIPRNEDGSTPDILTYVFGEEFSKTPSYEVWQEQIVNAQLRLNAAKDKLDALLSGSDTREVAIKKLQVESATSELKQAQNNLNDYAKELELALAQDSAKQADQSLAFAKQSLELAQKKLGEATIVAPFDGVIAEVKAKQGDVVDASTMIIHLVKPNSLELIVEIDEIDIAKVTAGQAARISVDAIPAAKFDGTVASVYPVPARVSGLVMYNVRITFVVPEETILKIGMRATADIAVGQQTAAINGGNTAT